MQPLVRRTAASLRSSPVARAPMPRRRQSGLQALPPLRANALLSSAATHAAVERLRVESVGANPYGDYAVDITPQGGMRMTFKTVDKGLGRRVVSFTLFALASYADASVLSPPAAQNVQWPNLLLLIAAIIINALIVMKPFEVLRSLEIRSDVLIVDGKDFFMRQRMESGWPAFQTDRKSGEFVLSGIYGTRQVEFVRVARLDEFDRAPEVLMAHLKYAMQQLWTPRPY